jgi:hypothetical protein
MSAIASATGSMGNALLLVALWLAFAFSGYRFSVRHRMQRGVTPWGFPSIVWGLICLAIGPIGILVEFFAGVTTRPANRPRVAANNGNGGGAQSDGVGITIESPVLLEPQNPLLAPPRTETGAVAAFGWYPDAVGNHHYRYFDGKKWSDQVADNGVISTDPLPA